MTDNRTIAAIGLIAVDRDGVSHELGWDPDQSLMEALRDNGLPVLASCGGTASCATCHVYLDAEIRTRLGARSDDETELLEETEHFDEATSRLSCQIAQDAALDGITVRLAPEED
ncbi:2Fe-2S iron-sulfur cluster-binding protein [Nocardia miyunensis]|uniref:2Fe-2S iron-sulfur cluster-binding protein n=1 Tax=Nocardia miyunensis TaxID=282684 RepID=UPI0008302969|nr:2Fe-2S iron-sulfur cluster-binding protein [Nocardia miyunensis]